MAENKSKFFLYLAYSEKGRNGELPRSLSLGAEVNWFQLELFASEKHDALIFTRPSHGDLDQILQLIVKCGVRHILDLRELPALTFEKSSREGFFDSLSTHHVRYVTIQSVFSKDFHADTVWEFLERLNRDTAQGFTKVFRNLLAPLIKEGPTIVFTESPPESDHIAQEFARSLARSDIEFSTVIASNK